MFLKYIKYYYLISVSLLFTIAADAQLGGPVMSITFGDAPTGNLSIPGPALPLGYTDFPYTTDVCPPAGSYAVVSGITTSCFNDGWIGLYSDNTPYPDLNGYMMLINDVAHSAPQTIFRDTIGGVCSGVDYQFSAAMLNVEKSSNPCVRFSTVTLRVEDYFGNLIASTSTGDIQFAVYSFGYHFSKYKVDFQVPPGTPGIVLKIIDEPKPTGTTCHNAFAVDDIQLKVVGPNIAIAFAQTDIGDWVKSSCFQDNKSFTMLGTIDSTISNPGVHWQQSTNDGLTWTDIPGANGYSLTQNFPVSDTFYFRLRGSDSAHLSFAACGVSSNLLKVEVDGLPKNIHVGSSSPVCVGHDLTFSVSGGTHYEWSGPNGFYDNTAFAHIYNSTLSDSGRYYVKVFTQGGCSALDSTDVETYGIDVRLGPDTAICKGNSVQLAGSIASGSAVYEWTPADGLSNSHIPNPLATPDRTTTYTLSAVDAAGCGNKGSITIRLRNEIAVDAKFISPDYVCLSYDSVLFYDNSQGKIAKWKWDFNNGQVSSVKNPPLQYYSIANINALYNVRLAVTDTAGCADSVTHLMRVADNCYMAVPTAFSPNGDGRNEYLYPLNAYKATDLLFMVYNRFGQLLFKTRDWNIKWDGKFGGLEQAPGTYVWMLEYTDAMGKRIFQKGTTILIR